MKPAGKLPLLIDTSEPVATAWGFDEALFTAERVSLDTGDYTVKGLEHKLTIERKTLGDAVNTVIHAWTRFRKTLYRMSGMECSIVLIEAAVRDVLEHRYESDADPLAVLGKLNSITIDHGIPVVFAGDRECAIVYAGRFLLQAAKKLGV